MFAGNHKHPLVNNSNNHINNHINGITKECDNLQFNDQQHHYIINNNRTSMISNGTIPTVYNGSSNNNEYSNGNSHLILNNNSNKNDYSHNNSIVTNNKIYHHRITNNNNHNNSIQNGVSKSVILNYDKNTLEYKNNKNLILNQHQNHNKVDINGNITTASNGYGNNHQMYEKHLNGINQLKNELQSTKRFVISTQTPTSAGAATNGDDNNNNKYHINIAKNRHQSSTDEVDNAIKHRLITENGSDTSNVLENIPANVNIHKVNGHLNGMNLSSNGHNFIKNGPVKVPDVYQNGKHNENNIGYAKKNGYNHEQSHKPNGFVRNCTNNGHGRSADFSTIKINYISRQIVVRGQSMATSNSTVSSTAAHTNGNANGNNSNNNSNNNHFHHHATVSLHDNMTKNVTNIPNIPNIVINGSNDGTSINGDYERSKDDDKSVKNGKELPFSLPFSVAFLMFSFSFVFMSFSHHNDYLNLEKVKVVEVVQARVGLSQKFL